MTLQHDKERCFMCSPPKEVAKLAVNEIFNAPEVKASLNEIQKLWERAQKSKKVKK